jgi:HPr Serine kinase C-terminal domain
VSLTFAFNRQALPLRTDFYVAGAHCHLSTNSADIIQSMSRWLRWRGPSPAASRSFEMEIIVDPRLDTAAKRPAYFRGNGHLVFGFLPQGSFITYDLLRQYVRAVLSSEAARDDSFWNALLIPITIGIVGTTVGVVPLHCACLERNGRGLLIAGDSGVGKSTLTAALTQRGLALISDDWTYFSKEQSTLVAHGLFSPIKLLPDAVQFFQELRDLTPAISLNGELAYEVDPARFAGSTVNTSRPNWIFLLERTPNPGCHFVPCSSASIGEFFEKNAERLPDELIDAKAQRTAIIRTLSDLPSWILHTGESPQRTSEAIDHFILETKYATA